jgi:hypothetical protein
VELAEAMVVKWWCTRVGFGRAVVVCDFGLEAVGCCHSDGG